MFGRFLLSSLSLLHRKFDYAQDDALNLTLWSSWGGGTQELAGANETRSVQTTFTFIYYFSKFFEVSELSFKKVLTKNPVIKLTSPKKALTKNPTQTNLLKKK